MRVVIILVAVSILCLSATAGAEEKGNKPIPVPKDMSKVIVDSPNPLPINHCDPNKPQDLEQDCAEDLLHMYQRLMIEDILNIQEERLKDGRTLPHHCGCPDMTGFTPEADNPLLKWRNDRCLENCKVVKERCDLSSQGYDRKNCLHKIFKTERKSPEKPYQALKKAELQEQPIVGTKDPMIQWRRLQAERIKREAKENPNDPCEKQPNNFLVAASCIYKMLDQKAKWEKELQELKVSPEAYHNKLISCNCINSVDLRSDPLYFWREELCLKACIDNKETTK